tara:strand:+ start:727 stop:882 length:156 start_codon:yes stop_codon:yes gene_type:complete
MVGKKVSFFFDTYLARKNSDQPFFPKGSVRNNSPANLSILSQDLPDPFGQG